MIVELNVSSLVKEGISASKYLVLYLFNYQKYTVLSNYLRKTNSLHDLLWAIKEGYLSDEHIIKIDKDTKPYSIDWSMVDGTNKLKVYLEGEVDLFDELYEEYPTRVVRKDNSTDYLKTDKKACKILYKKITGGQRHIHNKILENLHRQLDVYKSTGKMGYMRRLKNWLSAEEWKAYEDDSTTKVKYRQPTLGYGTKLS